MKSTDQDILANAVKAPIEKSQHIMKTDPEHLTPEIIRLNKNDFDLLDYNEVLVYITNKESSKARPHFHIEHRYELWNLAVDMNGKVFKISGNISKEQVKNVEVKVKEWLTNSNKVMPRVTNRYVAMTAWEMKGN